MRNFLERNEIRIRCRCTRNANMQHGENTTHCALEPPINTLKYNDISRFLRCVRSPTRAPIYLKLLMRLGVSQLTHRFENSV